LEGTALRDLTTITTVRLTACGVVAGIGIAAGAIGGLTVAGALYPGAADPVPIAVADVSLVAPVVPPPARSSAREASRAGSDPVRRAAKPRHRRRRAARVQAAPRPTVVAHTAPVVAPAPAPAPRVAPPPVHVVGRSTPAPRPRPPVTFDDSG
jgi:pyruvate dehydrogenase E2 component (dihydrolipoamide acetyltransferase)